MTITIDAKFRCIFNQLTGLKESCRRVCKLIPTFIYNFFLSIGKYLYCIVENIKDDFGADFEDIMGTYVCRIRNG